MSSKDHPWDRIFKAEGRVFSEPFPRFQDLVKIFDENRCLKILDLGCGNGRHVVGLAQEGFAVVGFDISPAGLRLTREWLVEEQLKAGVVLADMREPFPFRDRTFDGLLSTQVIHHARIDEIRNTIEEIRRVLAFGGLAFVTVAARKHEDEHYEEIEPGTFVPLAGSEAGLPHHIFSEEELRNEFRDFQVVDVSIRAEGKIIAILIRKL